MSKFIIKTMDLSIDNFEMIDVTIDDDRVIPIHYAILHNCQRKYNLSFANINLLCGTKCWVLIEDSRDCVGYTIRFEMPSIDIVRLIADMSSPDFELFKPDFLMTPDVEFDHESYQINEALGAIDDHDGHLI